MWPRPIRRPSCLSSVIVLLWTPGKTVRRSEPSHRPGPGWHSGPILFILGSAHMGRRCCGDVELVVIRPQKKKMMKRTTEREVFGQGFSAELAVYTAGPSRRYQARIAHTIVSRAICSPLGLFFLRLSRPHPSLLSCALRTPSINSRSLHSRPFSAATGACCRSCRSHAGRGATP